MTFLVDHMWQSLQVFGCAALFAFLTRHNPARFRQWLWHIAAIKFVVPFHLVELIGRWISFPVNYSDDPIPAWLEGFIDDIAPWFAPAGHLDGSAFWLLLAAELAAVTGAAWWIRHSLRLEAPRVSDELARLEKDPDDHPRGVGFFNAALMTAWTLLVILGPLTSGAIDDRLRRQALLRKNEASLKNATVVFKPAAPGMGSRMRVTVDSDGVTIRNATLQEIGGVAYGVSRFAVYSVHYAQEGQVDWLAGERHDVRITGRVIKPEEFDTYALREVLTRKLAVAYGVEIYVNARCQPPCGKWGSYVLPPSMQH